jgi:endonuclease YncB( thermonuclease family)
MTDPRHDPRVWIFPGLIRRWIDGDTFEGDLNEGFRQHYIGPCRIAHLDTPERNQPVEWATARDHALQLCPVGSAWVMRSVALDKYGRPLVEIDLGNGDLHSFADAMIQAGHGVSYELARQIMEA